MLGELGETRKPLDRGQINVAINKLQDFRDQMEGQAGNAISQSDAELMDTCAYQTIRSIEGPCQ